MKCEEFEDRLNQVLDEHGRPEWDDALRLHGGNCPSCRELVTSYGTLLDGFYALTTPQPPADLAQRVLDEMRVARVTRRRTVLAVSLFTTAAAALVAVVPLLNAPVVDNQQVAIAGIPAPRPQLIAPAQLNAVPVVGSLFASGEDSQDAYAELAKDTGQGLANVVLYVPGIGGQMGIIDAKDPAWAGQMSAGLKPVTQSVTETVNLLLRIVPGVQTTGKS